MDGFEIGQMVRLKPSITRRPDYFNQNGKMDWMLTGAGFQIHSFDTIERLPYVVTKEGREDWHVLLSDIVPLIIDNRRIENV